MKINLINGDESIKKAVAEAADLLNAACGDVLTVEAARMEKSGYSIERSGENRVKICYGSIPAFCRALMTAVGGASDKAEAECCFSDFGIMVDCSRNGVLNVNSVKKLIKYAAFMGYSYVGLYTEDTLEVTGEPYFGYMRGRYSQDEIRGLVAYGEIFGVELRPFIQTLAHLNQIVRYKDYSGIIDADDILLIDDDRTYELIENIIRSVSKCYKTKMINIGMDEAMMVGLGKYRERHGVCDRFEIMKRHLKRVLEICEKYGFKAEMWSDMFFRIATGGSYSASDNTDLSMVEIPDNVTLCYWDYYSKDKKNYCDMMKQHKKLTDRISFAGGAWKWHGFAPYNRFSVETGKLAIDACRENGIKHCTITCWGDDGDECSIFAVLPSLFADAAKAYGEEPEKNDFLNLTGLDFDEFMLSDRVNPGVGDGFTQNNMSKNLLYNDPLIGTFDNLVKEDTGAYYAKEAEKLLKLSSKAEFGYLFETWGRLCRVLELKVDLGVRIKRAYDAGDKQEIARIVNAVIPELLTRLEVFYDTYKKQWMKENKSFGFEVQTVRLGGLKQRIKDTAEVLSDYASGKTARIPEMDESRLPFAYKASVELEHTIYNRWYISVSPSRIEF